MISRAAKGFADFVRGDEPLAVLPGFLRPIDTDALARDLKITAAGAQRGRDELPRTDETNFDAVEQAIIQRIESVWAWQGDELIKNLRA